jgi:hypothetical protein
MSLLLVIPIFWNDSEYCSAAVTDLDMIRAKREVNKITEGAIIIEIPRRIEADSATARLS